MTLDPRLQSLIAANDFVNARALCSEYCARQPGDPELWFTLGSIEGALGDFVAAEVSCLRALAIAPSHPMLNLNAGIATLRQGKLDAAIRHLGKATRLAPDLTQAWMELGRAQSLSTNWQDAGRCFTKATQLEPASADAHLCLAESLRETGDLENSCRHYRSAISNNSKLLQAWVGLGQVLLTMYRYDDVIRLISDDARHLPPSTELAFLLATAYLENGDTAAARPLYHRVLEADPDHLDANVAIANIDALEGDYPAALDRLDRLLQMHAANPVVIITYINLAGRMQRTRDALERGTALLEAGGLTKASESRLRIAMANLLDREGRYEAAFEMCRAGNRLKGARFDAAATANKFTQLQHFFDSERLSGSSSGGQVAARPVFIVGMMRSGTSLAEQILASHPAVHGAGELPTINRLVAQLAGRIGGDRPYPDCLDDMDTGLLDELRRDYLQEATRDAGGINIITDKMPHNGMHLGFISMLFPDSPVIYCVRDARDTCLSCYFKDFSGEHPFTYDLRDLGNFSNLYAGLMQYWQQTIPNPFHVLEYEALVQDTEQQIRDLVAFCGLAWDETCLEFHSTRRKVATASHEQVRSKMYTSSIGRWRHYEPFIGELLRTLDG